jgi:serine/threonine-protein kinase
VPSAPIATTLLSAPSDAAAVPAAPIDERFALGRPLGRGGMGVVVEAADREVHRAVAVKHLAASAGDVEARLLLDEARLQGHLDHPAIPSVYDLGRDRAGRPAFAMRKVGGVTLAAVLAASIDDGGRRVGVERLLRIFVDVCLALEHAHARGVVHCDLKPANLMVDDDDRVHVIDWGVATTFGAAPGAGVPPPRRTGGTVGYMAPEQLDPTATIDARVDVHALGCVLFEILAGEPLRSSPSTGGEPDPRPSQRPAGARTPPALDQACAIATARRPDDRYPSAGHLAAVVTDWLDHERDRALRADLARDLVARARAATASEAAADRERALADAGHALALDPDAAEAAALIQALLASDDVPPAAAAEIAAIEQQVERKLARAAAISYLGFLLFPLTLLLQGHPAPWMLVASLGGWAGLEALALAAARGRGPDHWLWWSLALLVGECVLFTRYLGPFLIAPALAALAAAGVMMHPRVRHRGLALLVLCLPTLVPFALETAGLLPPTMRFDGDGVRFTSQVSDLRAAPTLIGLVTTSLALLGVAQALGRGVAAPAHRARRQLAAQAWHLESLLPASARPPPNRAAP